MTTAFCDKPEDGRPFCFRLLADAEPQTLSRIVGHFARLGITPSQVHAEVRAERLMIEIEQAGLSQRQAMMIAERLRTWVCIETVELEDSEQINAAGPA